MKFCLYFWIVLAFASVCLTSPLYYNDYQDADCGNANEEILLNCSTESGPNPNATCIFPFKFKNFTYHQCTTADNAEGDITPWCSTLIDDSGEHIGDAGNWGYCGPNCSLDLSCK